MPRNFRSLVYGFPSSRGPLKGATYSSCCLSLLLLFHVPLGSVLAVDVVAPEPLPPFPASIMDGYA
ncbi:unnamed protein product, partial [Laminaria digitata]